MTTAEKIEFWVAILVMAAAIVWLAAVPMYGQAFTAPGGMYRVENGRAVLNPDYRGIPNPPERAIAEDAHICIVCKGPMVSTSVYVGRGVLEVCQNGQCPRFGRRI